MIRLGLPVVAALVLIAGAAAPTARADAPSVAARCNGALSCSGWFTQNVTVTWDISGATSFDCQGGTVDFDTSAKTFECTAYNGPDWTYQSVTVKRDATPPGTVTASPDRPADSNGWYNHPLTVAFSAQDATSGVASCTSAAYAGPDAASAGLAGTCTDIAGNVSAPATFAVKYDATAPTGLAAVPARPADANGWYNHALQVRFTAQDATSGIGQCDEPTYGGPDGTGVRVAGGCADRAGNRVSGSIAFDYDATAPEVARLAARADKGFLAVEWQVSADTTAVELVRRKAKGAAKSVLVFKGRGARFRDTKVAAKTAYRYELAARDQAGNVARKDVRVVAPPKLYAPRAGKRVRGRPLLAWRPVPKARYYNVQLFRGKTKVLSVWPSKSQVRLPRSWRYLGRSHRLARGVYRWVVWPGYGARSASRYGKPLGQSRFVYRR